MKPNPFAIVYLLFISAVLQAATPPGAQTLTIHSELLNETRTVFVALPPKYEENTHDYPIIYVLDADFLFDITRSMTQLRAARNYMPESIIIGLPNTWEQRFQGAANWQLPNGNAFFNPPGDPQKFLQFIKQELIPQTEGNFRTNQHRTLIGLSPTTGPVFEALWTEPGLFKAHVALAIAIDMVDANNTRIADQLITSILDPKQPAGTSVYVGIAGNDVAKRPERGPAFDRLNQTLQNQSNHLVRHRIEIIPNEEHYGVAVPGIQRALELIYPREDWNVRYETFWEHEQPAQAIQEYYAQLSEKYGFTILPLQHGYFASHNLLGVGRRLRSQKRFQQRLGLFELGLQYYPNSAFMYLGLAESYQALEQHDHAIEAAKKAVELGAKYQHANLPHYIETLNEIKNTAEE